jgi:hypothetical protein
MSRRRAPAGSLEPRSLLPAKVDAGIDCIWIMQAAPALGHLVQYLLDAESRSIRAAGGDGLCDIWPSNPARASPGEASSKPKSGNVLDCNRRYYSARLASAQGAR